MSSKDFPIGWCIDGGKRLGELERDGAELTSSGRLVPRGRWSAQKMRESAARGGKKGTAARVANAKQRRAWAVEGSGDD
jgi:hypothetical protein